MEPHVPSLKRFSQLMAGLGQQYGRGRVFDDFLTMATCALHPGTLLHQPDAANENEYLEVVGRYPRQQVDQFGEALACLIANTHESPYSDLLGTWFEEHLSNERAGQFFTPMNLCVMMAKMTMPEDMHGQHVCDPCCGSGRLLLSSAAQAPGNWYSGADIDLTCARMTAINCFLNGLRGEIAWMDSLRLQIWRVWAVHTKGFGIVPVPAEASNFKAAYDALIVDKQAQLKAVPPPPLPPVRKDRPRPPATPSVGQLMLF